MLLPLAEQLIGMTLSGVGCVVAWDISVFNPLSVSDCDMFSPWVWYIPSNEAWIEDRFTYSRAQRILNGHGDSRGPTRLLLL